MSLPIETKIITLIDSDHGDRVPAVLNDFFKTESNTVKWGFVDEFGQPLLLRLIETASSETMDIVLRHINASELLEIKCV